MKPDFLAPAAHSIFIIDTQQAVYELARKCPLPPKTRLIVFGASSSQAYDPDLLRDASSAQEVVNLSVTLANFTLLRQVFADLQACLGQDGLRRTAFVLVPSIGSFTANGMRSEGAYSDYETVKLRSHLFAGPPGGVRPRLPRGWMRWAVELSRPAVLAVLLGAEAEHAMHVLRHPHEGDAARAESASTSGSGWLLRCMSRLQPGPYDEAHYAREQIPEFTALIAGLQASGAAVVMAEPPTQSWLRQHGDLYPAFHRTVKGAAERLSVPYLDLSASAEDAEFIDPLHANRQGAPLWSRRLAAALVELQRREPGALGPAAQPAGVGNSAP